MIPSIDWQKKEEEEGTRWCRLVWSTQQITSSRDLKNEETNTEQPILKSNH